MKKLLVIGGLGNIGYHFLKKIERKTGYSISCVARSSDKNRKKSKKLKNINFIWADIVKENIDAQLLDSDIIVYLAAILPPNSETKSNQSMIVNCGFVSHMLETVSSSTKIIFISTSGVKFYKTKSKSPLFAKNYLMQKKQAELILQKKSENYIIIRLPFVFEEKFPQINSKLFQIPLDNKMEFIDIDDVVENIYSALSTDTRIINLGGNPECQIRYKDYISFCFAGNTGNKKSLFSKEVYPTDWVKGPSIQQKISFKKMILKTQLRHPLIYFYRKILRKWNIKKWEKTSPFKY